MNYFTISNGDTDEYTCFSWPLWDATGKGIKAMLDTFIDKSAKNWHPVRKVWFIHNSVSDIFIRGIKALIAGNNQWQIKDQRTTVEAFNDFFETPPPVGQALKTKQDLLLEFRLICNKQMIPDMPPLEDMTLDISKKIYRKAALALHPDRNNGDGSKMAELNIIWAELQTKF